MKLSASLCELTRSNELLISEQTTAKLRGCTRSEKADAQAFPLHRTTSYFLFWGTPTARHGHRGQPGPPSQPAGLGGIFSDILLAGNCKAFVREQALPVSLKPKRTKPQVVHVPKPCPTKQAMIAAIILQK